MVMSMRIVVFASSVLIYWAPSLIAQKGNYPPKIEAAEEYIYKRSSHTDLKLWMFKPENWTALDSRAAIVFFFGGGWSSGSPAQFVPHSEYLSKRGMVAFAADYRVKSRHGVKANACVEDARDAMAFLRLNASTLGINPERIASAGGSAGGHLAACVGILPGALASKANAMALFNPAVVLAPVEALESDQGDRFSGLRERMGIDPIELSPYHKITSEAPPCIIFHGIDDEKVPFLTVELFADKMTEVGANCVLHGYKGEGHGFFNANRKRKGTGPHPFSDTLKQLDDFLVDLGWLEQLE